MCLGCEVLAISLKHCSIVKATMVSVCIVEVKVNVSNIKIINIALKCFCERFMSPVR
jgi:hypothetical protein